MHSATAVMMSALVGVSAIAVNLLSAQAGPAAKGFVCSTFEGVPSTYAVKADGSKVPVIRWTSDAFVGSGWTQDRRCQAVSSRFDQFLKEGRLTYITTGRMNGLPVICTSPRNGGACDGLLYTLKPGQNATATLQKLLDIRYRARGPLNETTSRIYISLDELLNAAEKKDLSHKSLRLPATNAQPASNLW